MRAGLIVLGLIVATAWLVALRRHEPASDPHVAQVTALEATVAELTARVRLLEAKQPGRSTTTAVYLPASAAPTAAVVEQVLAAREQRGRDEQRDRMFNLMVARVHADDAQVDKLRIICAALRQEHDLYRELSEAHIDTDADEARFAAARDKADREGAAVTGPAEDGFSFYDCM